MYHSEENQEDFLVLAGECKAIVNGRNARWSSGTSCIARPERNTCSWEREPAPAGS